MSTHLDALDRHTGIYLVRHAHAGQRTTASDDWQRPLSAKGRYQASVLAKSLAAVVRGDILSSPFVRCVETMEPLAARSGREVLLDDALAEGAEVESLLQLLERVPERSVLCTHGDLLRATVDRLDTLVRGPACFEKGAVWVLVRQEGRISHAESIPPPAASAAGV
jgi:8-oxo-dGTP diphosphatase